MEELVVSVFCITYNHEPYIRDAIEGFLDQKTNFVYEIIIHDDASTDNTAKIIREYELKYPNLIKGIFQDKNQYGKSDENKKYLFLYHQIVKNCKGKYVAVCDGDDFWIDSGKLQMQVDYMEQHPECMMTAHNEIVLDCKKFTVVSMNRNCGNSVLKANELIPQKILLQPSSRVFRRKAWKLNDFLKEFGIGDYPTILHFLEEGTIYYFDRIMAVYRHYSQGSWSENISLSKKSALLSAVELIDLVEKYNDYTKRKYDVPCICQIQRMADSIIYWGEGLDEGTLIKICEECNIKKERKYRNIIGRLIKLHREISNVEYLDNIISEFVKKHSKIYIMGAGNYANIIAKKLEFYGMKYEGFIISNNQNIATEYMGKPVWKFKDIDIKNIGIIIGINPVIWDEITCSLTEFDVENYICPFLL